MEAKILPLRTRAIELEKVVEASKSKMKKGALIKKCNWVVLRPSSSNKPRGLKKSRLN